MHRKVLAVIVVLLLAVAACTTSPPTPKTPVDKTMTWETNGLEVAVTFYCHTIIQTSQRGRVTVEVTNPHTNGTPIEVSFTIVANGNEVDQRPPTKLTNRDDSAWLSHGVAEHKAFSIFVYKDGTLIATVLLKNEPCAPGDQ